MIPNHSLILYYTPFPSLSLISFSCIFYCLFIILLHDFCSTTHPQVHYIAGKLKKYLSFTSENTCFGVMYEKIFLPWFFDDLVILLKWFWFLNGIIIKRSTKGVVKETLFLKFFRVLNFESQLFYKHPLILKLLCPTLHNFCLFTFQTRNMKQQNSKWSEMLFQRVTNLYFLHIWSALLSKSRKI